MANQTFTLPSADLSRSGTTLTYRTAQGEQRFSFNRDLRNGSSPRYLSGIRYFATENPFLRVDTSIRPTTFRDNINDISDEYENNGYLIFQQETRKLVLYIGGQDTSAPYIYRFSGSTQEQVSTFFSSVDTSKDLTVEFWDERPSGLEQEINLDFKSASVSNKINAPIVNAEPPKLISNILEKGIATTSSVQDTLLKGFFFTTPLVPEMAAPSIKRYVFEPPNNEVVGLSRKGIGTGGIGFNLQQVSLQGGEAPSIELFTTDLRGGPPTGGFTENFNNYGYLTLSQGDIFARVSIGRLDDAYPYEYQLTGFGAEQLNSFVDTFNPEENIDITFSTAEPPPPTALIEPNFGKGTINSEVSVSAIEEPLHKIEPSVSQNQIISQFAVSKIDPVPRKIVVDPVKASLASEVDVRVNFIGIIETFPLPIGVSKSSASTTIKDPILFKAQKIASPNLNFGKGSIVGGQSAELLDDNQRIEDVFGRAYATARSVSKIKINKPNIRQRVDNKITSSLTFNFEAITLPDIYDIPVSIVGEIESTSAPTLQYIPVIDTIEVEPDVARSVVGSKLTFKFEQKLTARIPSFVNSGVVSSNVDITIETGLFRGQRLVPSVSAAKIKSGQDQSLFRIKPAPASNRFVLRPIDLTIAGPNVIALWQPPSGSLLPVPQDLWARNQQLFLGFVRLGTSGVVQLRFRASQVAPSLGENDDISDAFENDGVILFEGGNKSVRLAIGGLDKSEPYQYNITGSQLTNLQSFLRSLPSTTNSLVMTLFDRNPPIVISEPAPRTKITSQNPINVEHISIYQIKDIFGAAKMANKVNILQSITDPTTRGTTIEPIVPQPAVGWAAIIEGIGLSREYFRVWSGVGQLEIDGDVFEGTTFEGGAFASVSPIEHSVGSPSSRVNISIAVPSAVVRDMLNIDIGPVWIRVFNIVSQDNGLSWEKLPTGIAGRLSRPSFDVEGSVYTIEIETYSGDADRGRPKIWSEDSQKRDYQGDRGFDFARKIESGVEIRWPP